MSITIGVLSGVVPAFVVRFGTSETIKIKRTKSGKSLLQFHRTLGFVRSQPSIKLSQKDQLVLRVTKNRFENVYDIQMLQYTLILLPAGLAPGLGIFCHWLKTRSHKNTQAKVVLYVKKAQSAKQYRVISLIDPHTTTPQESAARRPNYDASYAASKTSPIWSPKSSNNEKGSSPHY